MLSARSRVGESTIAVVITVVLLVLLAWGYWRYRAYQAEQDRQQGEEAAAAALADPLERLDQRLAAVQAKLDREIPEMETKLVSDLAVIRSDWEGADAVQRVDLEREIREVASLQVALANYRKRCEDVVLRLRSARRGLERARLSADTMGSAHAESLREADHANEEASGLLAVPLDANLGGLVDELAVERAVQDAVAND